MKLAIMDESGWIQIPQIIREQLGFTGQEQFLIEVQDSKLILKPLLEEPEVYYEEDVLVVNTKLLANPDIFIEELRQERSNQIMQ